jgi:NAD(P)-dependent dehydrogenase (short-subunit alcohol dehydrogenase family)
MRLSGKTALITGATWGIGEAIASLFASHGCAVAVAGRATEKGHRVVEQIQPEAGHSVFVRADIRRREEVKGLVTEAVAALGHIDILVNNAAHHPPRLPLAETTEDDWDDTITTNLTAVFLACKHVIPLMIEHSGGCIINLSSPCGMRGCASNAAYGISKGAMKALTQSIACDYGAYGIRANVLCPGTIDSSGDVERSLTAEERQERMKRWLLPRWGQPRDVARAALYLASDEASFVTGSVLFVDGGRMAM